MKYIKTRSERMKVDEDVKIDTKNRRNNSLLLAIKSEAKIV